MNNIICDSCKKVVSGAKRDVSYFTFQNKALCKGCYDNWDKAVRSEMGKKDQYSMETYKETMKTVIAKQTR